MLSLMTVTPFGIVMPVSFLHPLKAFHSMLSTDSGIFMLSRLEHFLNASLCIAVTLSGMIMLFKL